MNPQGNELNLLSLKNHEDHTAAVKTTPQKTGFRDVKYARIWDAD